MVFVKIKKLCAIFITSIRTSKVDQLTTESVKYFVSTHTITHTQWCVVYTCTPSVVRHSMTSGQRMTAPCVLH